MRGGLLWFVLPWAWSAEEPGPGWWSATTTFAQDTVHDTGTLVTAPLRWDGRTWVWAGAAGAAIGVTMLTLDQQTRREAQSDRSAHSDRVARYANPLGTVTSLGVIGAGAIAGWTLDSPRSTAMARDGLEASIIASCLIAPALKISIGRVRPYDDNDGADDFRPFSGNLSFPSGHTTQAFAVAAVAANTWREEPWVGVLAFGAASVVGYARVNDNAHYTSDVMAGALLGGVIGWSVADLNRARRDHQGAVAWEWCATPQPEAPSVGMRCQF